ncbi:PilZ domain-containing protein [Oceanobacter kriegii]|uniref:PilZ domain-containing protein n=1 Tax=Oceanobacter kriegii TaxID=64972 RepID=UPI0004018DC7|nr:PilZ domain-containing protein [Oceanobacter kriegii]
MTKQHELREEPRNELTTNVSVFRADDLSYVGLLLNCSDKGMMFSSYESIEPGTELGLELVDVRPASELHRTGFCKIEVVWSKPLTPSLYSVGCRLHSPCPTMHTMIRSYRQAS